MIEHVIFLVVEALAKRQQAEQQANLDALVPEIELLRRRPADVLATQDIVIPAARRVPLTIAAGILVGAVVSGVVLLLTVLLMEVLTQANAPGTLRQFLLVLLVAIIFMPPVVTPWLLLRAVRGGELILRRDGPEFRYRHRAVSCPWALFRAAGAARGDNSRVVVPIASKAIERVELLWHGSIIAYGQDVRLKPFRFVSDTEVELRNVYAANLRDVARLLQRLGQQMS